MIEKLIPLEIPPGIVMNGTLDERAGRWIDGNMVRFLNDGTPTAGPTFTSLSTNVALPAGTPRAAFLWFGTTGGTPASARVVCVTTSNVYVIRQDTLTNTHTITNITPASWADFSATYSFGVLNNTLLFTRAGAAVATGIWAWTGSGVAVNQTVPGGNVRGVYVTAESFVTAITGTSDIDWATQGGYTDWTPTSLNSAGGLTAPTSGGPLIRGAVVREKNLLWTTKDLWSQDYIGGDLVYGLNRVAEGVGMLGPNCLAVTNDAAFWMGDKKFYVYDGFVRELPCDVSEYVFGSIRHDLNHMFFAVHIPAASEIHWHYVSAGGATSPDRVVIYNYGNQTWSKGQLSRRAGTDAGWPPTSATAFKTSSPIMFDDTAVYQHEWLTGGAGGVATGCFLESGPIKLGEGDQTMKVQKLVPDGARFDFANPDTITLFAGGFPQQAETSVDVPLTGSAGPQDARFSARYIRYKQTLVNIASRIGIPHLGIIPSGKR